MSKSLQTLHKVKIKNYFVFIEERENCYYTIDCLHEYKVELRNAVKIHYSVCQRFKYS